ncbi:MAG: hypothetical protein QOE64_2861 [Frankiales bacterium]|jgi:DNA-binding protein HU-beta|nr:hypothetical protein [Frankiales bacterium]
MSDTVELTDLEVITRFSLAVRSATAERADVIAALRSDLAWLEGGRTRAAASAAPKPAPARTAPPKKAAPVKRAAATTVKKAPAKKAAAKKAPAKKATRRR